MGKTNEQTEDSYSEGDTHTCIYMHDFWGARNKHWERRQISLMVLLVSLYHFYINISPPQKKTQNQKTHPNQRFPPHQQPD